MRTFITCNKKSALIVMAVVLVSVLLIIGLLHPRELLITDLPISRIVGSSVVDRNDVAAVVGEADYVFIGRVDKLNGTDYRHPVKLETENGYMEYASPYTDYSITVIKNIKGNLRTDISVNVHKSGGVSIDESVIELFEDDTLPEVDNIYVFIAYAQPDGSLLVSGPNSNIPLDISNKKEMDSITQGIEVSKKYQVYLEAYKNEKKLDRKRFVANDDMLSDTNKKDNSNSPKSSTYTISPSTSVMPAE